MGMRRKEKRILWDIRKLVISKERTLESERERTIR